jgi:hypothetical protein
LPGDHFRRVDEASQFVIDYLRENTIDLIQFQEWFHTKCSEPTFKKALKIFEQVAFLNSGTKPKTKIIDPYLSPELWHEVEKVVELGKL